VSLLDSRPRQHCRSRATVLLLEVIEVQARQGVDYVPSTPACGRAPTAPQHRVTGIVSCGAGLLAR
jgi:thiamine biosynthesis protein ThiC